MELTERKRFNNLWLGVRLGLFVPFGLLMISLLVIYFRLEAGESLWAYVLGEGIPSRLLSLVTLGNLVTFLLSIRTDRLLTARGILGATVVLAITSVALRLFL